MILGIKRMKNYTQHDIVNHVFNQKYMVLYPDWSNEYCVSTKSFNRNRNLNNWWRVGDLEANISWNRRSHWSFLKWNFSGFRAVILETGNSKTRASCKCTTTSSEDRTLTLKTEIHWNMNPILFQQHFHSATGTTVSIKMLETGSMLYVCMLADQWQLLEQGAGARRKWTTGHVDWRRNEWCNIIFT